MELDAGAAPPPPLPSDPSADPALDAWLQTDGAEDSSDGEDEYAAWLDGALGAARAGLQRAKAEELRLERRLAGKEDSAWSRFLREKDALIADVTTAAQASVKDARAACAAAAFIRPPPPPTLAAGDFRPPPVIEEDARAALEACIRAVESLHVAIQATPGDGALHDLQAAAASFVVAFWRRRFLLRPRGSLGDLEQNRRRFAAKRSAFKSWLGVEALSEDFAREQALGRDRAAAADACAAAEKAIAERREQARRAEVARRAEERDAEDAARAAGDARTLLDLRDACDAAEAAKNATRALRKLKRAKTASAYTTIAAFVSLRAWRRKRATRTARRAADAARATTEAAAMRLADMEARKAVEFWRVEALRELRERMLMWDAEQLVRHIVQARERAQEAEARRRGALRADAERAKRVARAAAVRLDMLARRRERVAAGDAAVACALGAVAAASDARARVGDVGAARRSAEAAIQAEAAARAAEDQAEAAARDAARAAAAALEANAAAAVLGKDRRAAAAACAEAMVQAFHATDRRDDAARLRARKVLAPLDPLARRLAVIAPACLQRAARLFRGSVPICRDAPPPPPCALDDWARRMTALVPPPPPRIDAPQAVYDDTPRKRSTPGKVFTAEQLQVSCGGDCTRVPTLDLSVEKLGGDLSSLNQCAKLEKLNLSVNELEAHDLVALGRALRGTRVRTLALRDNRLAGGLSNLNQLKLTSLHLDVNRLTSLKALGALACLRELSVCDNKLGASGDGGLSAVLRCAPCLEVLRAAGNALASFDCFARAPRLKELELSRNTLADFDGAGASSSFPALVDLGLAHNALRQAPAGLRLARLEKLRIGGNRFERLDDLAAQQAWLPRLQRLDAADGALAVLGEALRCCPGLEILNVAHNAIVDGDALSESLRCCPVLRDVMAQGNPLPLDALSRACTTAWKDQLACGGGAERAGERAAALAVCARAGVLSLKRLNGDGIHPLPLQQLAWAYNAEGGDDDDVTGRLGTLATLFPRPCDGCGGRLGVAPSLLAAVRGEGAAEPVACRKCGAAFELPPWPVCAARCRSPPPASSARLAAQRDAALALLAGVVTSRRTRRFDGGTPWRCVRLIDPDRAAATVQALIRRRGALHQRPRVFAALAAAQCRRDACLTRLQARARAARVRRRVHRALDGCVYVDADLANFDEGVDVDAFLGGAPDFAEEALPAFVRRPPAARPPAARPPSADTVLPDIFAGRRSTPDHDLRSSSAPHSLVVEPKRRRRRHRPAPAPVPTSQIARDRQSRVRSRKVPAWASKPG